jgi:hypothetical protein
MTHIHMCQESDFYFRFQRIADIDGPAGDFASVENDQLGLRATPIPVLAASALGAIAAMVVLGCTALCVSTTRIVIKPKKFEC